MVSRDLKKSEMVSGDLKQRNEQRSKKKENIRERAPVQKKVDQGNKKIFKSRDEPKRASTYSSSKAGIGNRNGPKRLDLVPAHKKSAYRKDVASLRGKSPLNPVNQKKLLDEPRIARKRKFQPVKGQPARDSPQSSPVSDRDINDRAIQQERPLSGLSSAMSATMSDKNTCTFSLSLSMGGGGGS